MLEGIFSYAPMVGSSEGVSSSVSESSSRSAAIAAAPRLEIGQGNQMIIANEEAQAYARMSMYLR